MKLTEFKAWLRPRIYKFRKPQYLWIQADIAHATGDHARAESIYRRLARRSLKSPDAYLYAGLAEQRLQRTSQALQLLESGLNKYPHSQLLLNNYSRICLEHGQIDLAISKFSSDESNERQTYEGLFAKFPEPHIQSNLIAHGLRKDLSDIAAQKLNGLLETSSDNVLLWRLADILLAQRHDNEARLIYRKLAAVPAENVLGVVHSSLSEYRLGNALRAADTLEVGIRQYPDATELLGYYAFVCSHLGQMDRVLRVLGMANGSDERDVCRIAFDKFPEPHLQASLISHCLFRGYADVAEEKLNALLEKDADSFQLWALADTLLHNRRGDLAKLIYQRLAARPAENAEGLVHSALSEHRLDNSTRAADLLEAGISKYPENAELVDHYAVICAKLGQLNRLIGVVAAAAKTEEQACEIIFDRFSAPQIQVGLIDYCLKAGLEDLAERKIKSIESGSGDPLAMWQVAELLLLHERTAEANAIHKKLTERSLASAEDYYLSSLAYICLADLGKCLFDLERGLSRYPREEQLLSLYMRICAKRHEYKRYLNFLSTPGAGFPAPVAILEFYRESMSAPVDFVIGLRDIESLFDKQDVVLLREDFLRYLEKNPQPIKIAKVLMFFCRYLDLPVSFGDGLYEVLKNAYKPESGERQSLLILNKMTPPMIPERPIDAQNVINEFIQAGFRLAQSSAELDEPIADMTNNWTPWQYVFCLVAPKLYGEAIQALEKLIFKSWPKLNFTAPHIGGAVDPRRRKNKKIRLGFIVHDSMPMMSGFLPRLDPNRFETVFLRPGKPGQSIAAKSWISRAGKVVQYSDVDMYAALQIIADEELDIIVSGPSIAAVYYPMMARLAPLQMVLLEPNWTDGLTNADYYISWRQAEPANPSDFYKTKTAFFQHPPYWIERPEVDKLGSISAEARADVRKRLLNAAPDTRIYLCANTPPKIHPDMDDIFFDILDRDKEAILVLLRGEYPPAQSLRARLRAKLGSRYERVIFVPTMSKDDAHMLLQSVDCCLDSYPLCGMSSSFDGTMLGITTVTLPAEIPFGRWTAAIYEYIGLDGLTAGSRQEYVDIALKLASDANWRARISSEMKEKSSRYVESQASSDEFQEFITQSWKRRLDGLPPSHWLNDGWR